MVVDLTERGPANGSPANGSMVRFPDPPSAPNPASSPTQPLRPIPQGLQPGESGPTPLAELLAELAAPLVRAEVETLKAHNENGGSDWEPNKLMPRHREIMRRLLEGATYIEVAEEMGMHPVSIGLIARTAIFKSELAKLEAEADFNVIKRADQLSGEALDTLKMLMRKARSEGLRKSAADSILDRAGYGKVEKKAIVSVTGDDVIRELNRRRREQSGASSPVPDPGAESQAA